MTFTVTNTITRTRNRTIATYAALRLTHGRVGDVVTLNGYATANDGGQGLFWWEDGVTSGHNGGTVVTPASGARGRWVRMFEGPIHVTWFGATGTYATDWTSIPAANTAAIEAALAVAVSSKRKLHFPMTPGEFGGIYVHTGINIADPYAALVNLFLEISGDRGVVLKHTGDGPGFTIDAGESGVLQGAGLIVGIRVRDLVLAGNDDTTIGLWLRGVHQSRFDDVRVEGCSENAFRLESCTGCTFYNPICSTNWRDFLPKPTDGGFWIGRRPLDVPPAAPVGWTSGMNTIVNLTMEGLPGFGLVLDDCTESTFAGGTCEGNVGGGGVYIGPNAYSNTLDGLTFVSNTGDDLDIRGRYNVIRNCQVTRPTVFRGAYTQWQATTAYVLGDIVSNASQWYLCITAGTSAGSGGPTTTAADITDGTAHWYYGGPGNGSAIANVLERGTFTDDVTNLALYPQDYAGPAFSSGVTFTDAVTPNDQKRIFRTNTATWGTV